MKKGVCVTAESLGVGHRIARNGDKHPGRAFVVYAVSRDADRITVKNAMGLELTYSSKDLVEVF